MEPRLAPRRISEQVLAVLAVSEGWLDGLPSEKAPRFVENLVARLRSEEPLVASRLERGELPEEGWLEKVHALAVNLLPTSEEGRS